MCYRVYKQLLRLEVIKERCLLSRSSMLSSQVVYWQVPCIYRLYGTKTYLDKVREVLRDLHAK